MIRSREALTASERQSVSRIAGLTVINAMVFQEVLAGYDRRVEPLRKTLEMPDPVSAFCEHWLFILQQINYVPIFKVAREVLVALASGADVDKAVRSLASKALDIVRQRAALRHDLMGRVYHRLLTEAKHLGTYYTSVPAATLLLKVALDPSKSAVDWADLDALSREVRIADFPCGTGTLLMAAAETVADNYVRACAEKGVSPDVRRLHEVLMEHVIYGYDVLPSALHLTASTLAIWAPDITLQQMGLYSLPLGGPHSEELEKALVLWLNSTLGLLILLAYREETEGAWVDFKKPTLKGMPVLDVRALADKQRGALAQAYDGLCAKRLLPFPEMEADPVRREIDEVIRKVLRLPDFGVLRQLLAREPVVCLRPLC